ncbi:MAG: PilZ domain-containing protein [Gammaproteobacteria bacterium]|nr:PilZ domain-containing protein [Gammaproteobacteria bacterium]
MIEQKREYYRVEYPENDRPALVFMDNEFEILDVSEGGVRFKVEKADDFIIGELVGATIKFADDYTFKCTGKIVRIDDNNIAINNIHHIPLERIRAEHLLMIRKYNLKH